MDVLTDLVEGIAAVVPVDVLEQVGDASRRMEAVLAWDEPERKITAAAQELDHARFLIPGFGLRLANLTREEAVALAHDLLRAAHFEAVAS